MSLKNQHEIARLTAWATTLSTLFLLACGGGGGGGGSTTSGTTPQTLNVTIHWAANKELRVNQSGGGYKVYISQTSGFNIDDSDVITLDAPWVSGTQAPLSKVQALTSGTYFVRVAAYTSFPVSNTSSEASSQIRVSVPFTTP